MIKGTLQETLEIGTHIGNLAGHISNYVTMKTSNLDGESIYVRLEKQQAASLIEELNNKLKELI